MTTPSHMLVGKRETPPPPRHKSRVWLIVILLLVAAVVAFGIISRAMSHADLKKRTEAEAIPTVSVVKPTLGPTDDDINLPGTLQAFVDAPLYARTDGYLKAWYFDIGAKVKKGQLIAVIETPELDQQLDQAKAAVGTARANYDLAVVTNKRYQALVRTAAVSRQEADQSASNEAAQKANVDAALANVKHYEALQSFEKLYAPFDGVVTARNTDIAQLVSAGIGAGGGSGGNTTGHELFRIAVVDRLRTFIPVPQNQSPYISVGMKADLHLVERPGKTFPAVVARTSGAIDNASRTLLTEVDIDNRNGELFPGAYVDVHLQIPSDNIAGAVRVPANTLIFRAHGLQVAVVGDDDTIKLHDAEVGRDFGNTVELVSGVGPDDQVVLNPPDSLLDGQKVKIAQNDDQGTTAAQDGHSDQKKDSDASGKKPEEKHKEAKTPQGQAPVKTSQAPVDKGAAKKGGTDTGGETDSGATAPGTDGNGAK